jgi:hypothetical protein
LPALSKWRDGPTGWQHEYKLASVQLGENADGKEVWSAFVEPVEGGGTRLAAVKKDKVGKGRPSSSEQIALRALTEAIAACGEPAPASNYIPEQVRVVTIDCWREYAYRLGISDGEARARQTAFKRAKDSLVASQRVGIWNEHVWAVPA